MTNQVILCEIRCIKYAPWEDDRHHFTMKLYCVALLLASLSMAAHVNPWESKQAAPDFKLDLGTGIKTASTDLGSGLAKKQKIDYPAELKPYAEVLKLFKTQGYRNVDQMIKLVKEKPASMSPLLLKAIKDIKPVSDEKIFTVMSATDPVVALAKALATAKIDLRSQKVANQLQQELQALQPVLDSANDHLKNFVENERGLVRLMDLMNNFYKSTTASKDNQSLRVLANFLQQKMANGDSLMKVFLSKFVKIEPAEHPIYHKHLNNIQKLTNNYLNKNPSAAIKRFHAIKAEFERTKPTDSGTLKKLLDYFEKIMVSHSGHEATLIKTFNIPPGTTTSRFFKEVQALVKTVAEALKEIEKVSPAAAAEVKKCDQQKAKEPQAAAVVNQAEIKKPVSDAKPVVADVKQAASAQPAVADVKQAASAKPAVADAKPTTTDVKAVTNGAKPSGPDLKNIAGVTGPKQTAEQAKAVEKITLTSLEDQVKQAKEMVQKVIGALDDIYASIEKEKQRKANKAPKVNASRI